MLKEFGRKASGLKFYRLLSIVAFSWFRYPSFKVNIVNSKGKMKVNKVLYIKNKNILKVL